MEKNNAAVFLNTLLWGFILWLFGYVLGMLLFAVVPKETIGWYILPLGVSFTLWVLFKKIKRESFGRYIGLGVIWTIIAIILDYIFIVMLLKATDYYKLDVYVYYALTLLLPIVVGWYQLKTAKEIE
jgi:hypothetical protein